ncbi:MAG TPA: stalk domain-containing protein [Fimbriimonas sp.]|nr:stalk domain-containing protein [Fimbriimonas sp.]
MNKSLARTCVIATMAMATVLAGAQAIHVEVNGRPVRFTNTEPRYIGGRVLVPLRGVFEDMGAFVQWHPETRTVTAQKGETDVSLRIGEKWASVDGQTLGMDVPAMILNGSTMVPIRFVSEALGAQVSWNDPSRTVMISTDVASNTRPIEFANTRKFTMQEGTVIPVTLQTRVSSRDSRRGDLVRAKVNEFNTGNVSWEQGDFDIPDGTMIEGRVAAVTAKSGNNPGMVELDFGRMVMPDGKTVNIDGSLIALDSKSVARNENGVLIAKESSKDNRLVYAGYGAGAGLIVGLLTKRPLENLAIGGILGYIVGTLEQNKKNPTDVNLDPGTRFGVRLDNPVTLTMDIAK